MKLNEKGAFHPHDTSQLPHLGIQLDQVVDELGAPDAVLTALATRVWALEFHVNMKKYVATS